MFDFVVVSGTVVQEILNAERRNMIACVADAYELHHQGKSINPDSYFLRFPNDSSNRIIALPAALTGDAPVSGIKWIASYPANTERNVPRASAVLILNDYVTGYPVVCMEASLISAVRTAASAVWGAYLLNNSQRRMESLGVVGAGVIARNIIEMFHADGWSFDSIVVHDVSSESASSCVQRARELGFSAMVAPSIELALQCAMVTFATTAGIPYVLPPTRLRPGQIVLNISLRDLAPELLLECENIVDDVEHCLKASTSLHLAEQMVGHRAFVTGTVAQLSRGEITLDPSTPRVFSPFGMGILDLMVGRRVFERAKSLGLCQPVPGFFAETSRWAPQVGLSSA